MFAPADATSLPLLTRWINECTRPDQRVSVIGFEPQIGGGHDRVARGPVAQVRFHEPHAVGEGLDDGSFAVLKIVDGRARSGLDQRRHEV